MVDMNNKSEKEVREHVKNLREFYMDLTSYALVNGLLIFIWIISGFGHFWPIWTIIFWGVFVIYRAMELELLPKELQNFANTLLEKLPFLKKDWEEKQVQDIMKKKSDSDKES